MIRELSRPLRDGEPSEAMRDPLRRFIRAQQRTYECAYRELAEGQKRSCWMWFVFPQLRGLARSRKSYVYGIRDAAEARQYIAHPVLGARLAACAEQLLRQNATAEEIFGETDAVKLRSSMTLFAVISGGDAVFARVLAKYFGGQPDPLTVALLEGRATDVTYLKYHTAVSSEK